MQQVLSFSIHNFLFSISKFRTHQESLRKLRKLISDSNKDIRHRRHLLNIQITFLGWLTEFIGFFMIFLGSFIIGHGIVALTLTLQLLTFIAFYIIVPCVYLVNESDFKAKFAESPLYFNFLKFFKSEKVNPKFLEEHDNHERSSAQGNANGSH